MTGRAATAAEVARVIIGSGKMQQWIQQPRLLKSQEHGVGARTRPVTTSAETLVGPARSVRGIREGNFRDACAAAFEDAQNVSRLRGSPLEKRIEKRQHAFQRLVPRRRRNRVNPLRQ